MNSRINTTRFWLTWIFASVVVYPFAAILLIAFILVASPLLNAIEPSGYRATTSAYFIFELLMICSIGGIVGLTIGFLQQSLLKRYFFPLGIGHWRRATIIGGMIAAPLLVLVLTTVGGYFENTYLQNYQSVTYEIFNRHAVTTLPMLVYVTVMSVAQVVILRQYVKHGWLWILANAVAGLMFGMIVSNFSDPPFWRWLLAAIAQGAVTGFAMLWLLQRLNYEPNIDDRKYAYQHVPIDKDEPSEPSVWDDAI